MNANMAGVNNIRALPFIVDSERHTENVITAIKATSNNKTIGTDGVHVEMLKPDAGKTAELLTGIWRLVGKYNIVANEWLEGITVSLLKGKGSQIEPSNYHPLTILLHARKITEKAVVLELDKQV